ncbi:hypothetical protein K2X05_08145 [bacterium]|nr:hypothetical protein [bacterium]
MKKLSTLAAVLLLAVSSVFAGPTTGGKKAEVAKEAGGKSAEAKGTLKAALKNAGMKEEIAELWAKAGLKEMSADTINKLAAIKGDQKTVVESLLSKMTITVANGKSVAKLGDNGALVVEAATTMATKVVETILNDKTNSVDLAKVGRVAKLLEEVSSVNKLKDEGSLLIQVEKINAELGNGRTIKDLKDCF